MATRNKRSQRGIVAWVIKNPDGKLTLSTVAETKIMSIGEFLLLHRGFGASWDEWVEHGFSVIKINICPVHCTTINQEMILFDKAIKQIKQNRDCRKRTIELNKDLSDIKLNAKTVSIFAMAADNDSIAILEELRQKVIRNE